MPKILREDAVAIAKKLANHNPPAETSRFSIESVDGKHTTIKIIYGGKWIAQYGITHHKVQHAGHSWVPRQMRLTLKQAAEFADCNLSHADYITILVAKKIIAAPED